MTNNLRIELARQGMTKAYKLRSELGIPLHKPVRVVDVCMKMNIEVRFLQLKSAEGMYANNGNKPVIIISSLRPRGRQNFTGGHELGHHVFGHGTNVDELHKKNDVYNPDEILADSFSNFFLMPKLAILNTFKSYGWDSKAPTANQIFIIANYFGVGYTTLIHHITRNLKLISESASNELLKFSPKKIKEGYLGFSPGHSNYYQIDNKYNIDVPLDAFVGDYFSIPPSISYEGVNLEEMIMKNGERILRATETGISKLTNNSDWAMYLRITKPQYEGLAQYRFMED